MSGPGNPSIFNNVPPPSIIPNIKLDNNTTIRYKTNQDIYANYITDGQAVWTLGYLKNLNDPIDNDQAATKYFVDNFGGSATPGGLDTYIQINDGSNGFTGSADLVFNNVSGLTTLNGTLTNSVITLTGDVLTGIATPVSPQDAANKAYVDANSGQLTDVVVEATQQIGQSINITYDDLKDTFLVIDFQ